MILTLFRRTEKDSSEPSQPEDIWRVRVGRGEGDRAEADILPASLLAPEIEAMQPYRFDDFWKRVERLQEASHRAPAEEAAWTALPLAVPCAQGEQGDAVAIRNRQAAELAVREWGVFARSAFPESALLWVRVE